MAPLDQLLKDASGPLAPPVALPADTYGLGDARGQAIHGLLARRNGFYAFVSALHLLPLNTEEVMDLAAWNAKATWREAYEGMADDALWFAEDAFGVQFGLTPDATVVTFDPETGRRQEFAGDLDGWAKRILDDDRVATGWPLAQAWQEAHGPLPRGTRLIPVTPFVAGGSFELANLNAVDAVEGMRYRAAIALQIKDLPEGATIRLRVHK